MVVPLLIRLAFPRFFFSEFNVFQENKKVVIKRCSDSDDNQRWTWDEQNEDVIKRVNSNMHAIVEPPELDYLS